MIFVIDNFDSFTYNLVQYLQIAGAAVEVRRNNAVSLQEIQSMQPDGILLSPGPCTPNESGVCLDIIAAALGGELGRIPIFGVCLGHQAIAHQMGSVVDRAPRVRHGKSSPIRHDGKGVFRGIPNPFNAIRYHSLAIDPSTLKEEYEITATAEDDGVIMGIRHRSLPIEGVQFHPESVLTEFGQQLIQNFVDDTRAVKA